MQITSGSAGVYPSSVNAPGESGNSPSYTPAVTSPDSGSNNSNNSSGIPSALNFNNVAATSTPAAIDFGLPASSDNGRVASAQSGNTTSGTDGDSMDSVVAMLKQLLEAFIQQLSTMLSAMGQQEGTDASSAGSGTGTGNTAGSAGDSTGGDIANSGDNSGYENTGVNGSGSTPVNSATTSPSQSSAPAVADDTSIKSTGTGDSSAASGDTSMPGLPSQLQQFSQEYSNAAKETGVPASTLAALTWTESRGDVGATSTNPGNGKTDGGINQINPDTYEETRQKYPDKLSSDSSDPSNQIMCSALLLRDYQDQFGSMDAALRAYNSGPGQVNTDDLSSVTLGNPNYINEVNRTAKVISSGDGTVPA